MEELDGVQRRRRRRLSVAILGSTHSLVAVLSTHFIMPARASSWKPRDGEASATAQINEALVEHFTPILYAGGWNYSSLDMKTGVDLAGLVLHAPCLKKLFQLDPRGALLRQSEVHDAISWETAKKANNTQSIIQNTNHTQYIFLYIQTQTISKHKSYTPIPKP